MILRLSRLGLLSGILLMSLATGSYAGEDSNSNHSILFPSDPFSFQPGKGQEIANAYCVICHSAEYIYMQPPHSQGTWTEIIHKMQKTFGCPIPDDAITTLASYLTLQNDIPPTAVQAANIQEPSTSSKTATGKPNSQNGKGIYTNNCINCHGGKGLGDGPIGKMLVPPAADLTVIGKKSDKELRATIMNGRPGTAMPSWKGNLSAQDITDVLAYVRSLSRK